MSDYSKEQKSNHLLLMLLYWNLSEFRHKNSMKNIMLCNNQCLQFFLNIGFIIFGPNT